MNPIPHSEIVLLAGAIACPTDPHGASQIHNYSLRAADLQYIVAKVPMKDSVVAVQVGTFVGVSLAYLAARMDGLIVSIDPGTPYQTVMKCNAAAPELINRLTSEGRLRASVAWMRGYALERPPVANYGGSTGHNQLPALSFMMPHRCDFVLLDSDSDYDGLKMEIAESAKLLRTGGALIVNASKEPGRIAAFHDRAADCFTSMYETNTNIFFSLRTWAKEQPTQ